MLWNRMTSSSQKERSCHFGESSLLGYHVRLRSGIWSITDIVKCRAGPEVPWKLPDGNDLTCFWDIQRRLYRGGDFCPGPQRIGWSYKVERMSRKNMTGAEGWDICEVLQQGWPQGDAVREDRAGECQWNDLETLEWILFENVLLLLDL